MVRYRKRTVFKLLLLLTIPALVIMALYLPVAQDSLPVNSNQHHDTKNKEIVKFQKQQFGCGAEKTQPRQNILIVAHGRSGSTITGDMFNHHPSVFYLHELLQTVQRLMPTANRTYGSLMADVLANILRCNFDQSVVEDLDHFYRQPGWPRVSHAIGSPPLCPYEMTDPRWDPKLCPPMTSASLGIVCRNNYEITVAKIILDRIAEVSIKNHNFSNQRSTRSSFFRSKCFVFS